jgi:hypothetical protein
MSAVLNRFTTLQDHLFKIFASSAWISEQLAIIPKGFVGSKPTQEYIEFNPVINGPKDGDSLAGLLYIDIYTSLDAGPKRAAEIADILDRYLAGKSFQADEYAVTQFQKSSNFEIRGQALNGKAFIMSYYQIQFGFFRKES